LEVGLADSPAFSWTCKQLERLSDFDRLESRGTIRIALKASGLESRSVTPDQMRVVIEKLLPVELTARGIDDCDSICMRLIAGLGALDAKPMTDSPDEIFKRLGGS
jgi:hypothetical protein